MKKVRMKVLREFSRNLDGQIVTGHPDHPHEHGRVLMVSEAAAVALEDEGDAKRWSYQDEAREEIDDERRQSMLDELNERRHAEGLDPLDALPDDDDGDDGERDDDDDDDDETGTVGDRDAADTRDIPGKPQSAQRRREARVAANVGGGDTNATTNHGTTSTDGRGRTRSTNLGASGKPDPDAAPKE